MTRHTLAVGQLEPRSLKQVGGEREGRVSFSGSVNDGDLLGRRSGTRVRSRLGFGDSGGASCRGSRHRVGERREMKMGRRLKTRRRVCSGGGGERCGGEWCWCTVASTSGVTKRRRGRRRKERELTRLARKARLCGNSAADSSGGKVEPQPACSLSLTPTTSSFTYSSTLYSCHNPKTRSPCDYLPMSCKHELGPVGLFSRRVKPTQC